ncbi:MAG TPA: M56 family metallopeptidase [Thermoanaerobaculia bacterium]|nr:M56 family metallopeptidase [Thermoanaerobaculia bacterium]
MNAFLAASLVKATLLLFATALALRALVRASAASRHLVALLGLALALAVPVLGLVLPRWEIPVLAPAEEPLPGTRAALPDRPESSDSLTGFSGRVGVQVPPFEESAAPPRRQVPPSLDLDVAQVATLLWLLGGLVPLAALAVGFRRARTIIRNARPAPDPRLDALVADVSARLGLSRSVPVLFSPEALVPMTANFFHPVLVLPDAARVWPTERQRVVLLHELAHVARRDLGALLVAELTTAAYWFHPLAHVVARNLRRSAEEASDDLVLGNDTRASDYASHLVGIVKGLGSPEEMPVLAMARPSDLEKRVRAILDPRRRRRAPSRLLTGSLAAVGIAAALALAAAVPGVARPAMAALPEIDDPPLASAAAPAAPCPKSKAAAPKAKTREDRTATEETRHETKLERRVVSWNEKTVPLVVFAANRKQSGSAAYARAKELYEDDHYLESAEAYRKAAELGYREDTAAYNAACSYALAGRKDDAFTWLGKAMELGFDLESYLRKDDDLDSLRQDPRFAELKKAARAARAEGKTADSVRAVRRFEKLTAEGSKNGARWYEAGKELLDAEKLDLSEKAFRTAASLGYRTGASTYNAACALARAGKVPQALDTLDASLEAGFDDPGLLGRDDDLEALHGDPRFAKLRKKAEDLSLGSNLELGVSRLFRRRSAWREEVPHYAAYAKAHPQSGRAHYNLGYAQLLAERPEAALPAFTRALELGYRKPATLYNLACTHARLEEKDKAFERLFQAIDAGYDSPSQIRHDEDLDSLHGDPRFKQALQRAGKDDEEDD